MKPKGIPTNSNSAAMMTAAATMPATIFNALILKFRVANNVIADHTHSRRVRQLKPLATRENGESRQK